MIIYLSKSNRCNPNHVMAVREELKSLFPDSEIREFTGGSYNRNHILESDLCFMVAESDPEADEEYGKLEINVGRGLYTEARLMLDKSLETGKHHLYYCFFRSNGEFTTHLVTNCKITNIDNYIRYGRIAADMKSTTFAEIVRQ